MQEEARLQALRDFGLVLLNGSQYFLSDFIYERPFGLQSNAMLVKCHGGGYSYVGSNCVYRNCEIGRYCSLADRVIVGVGAHNMEAISTSSMTTTSFMFGHTSSYGYLPEAVQPCVQTHWWPQHTKIGNDVWLGLGVFIPGAKPVNIGDGAIIGAKAVVTKDVPPYAIAVGNPARVVKMRFKDEICADLHETRWFDYDFNAAAAVHKDIKDKAKMTNANEFLAWWKDEGKELMQGYKMSDKKFIANSNGSQITVGMVD